ncbi:MAG: UDP-N-acetylglucosamine 2-epimerase (non-hydrolyzing) [Thermodesulfobacteriota bacterium]
MKLITIVGARPQFIKAAAVSRAIAAANEAGAGITEKILHTGQHYDDRMSRVFFTQMGIPDPAYNLGVNSLGHGAMTGRMMEGIEEVLQKERPDCVLIYGDTDSTLAGALAAVKMKIKVAHVEAGLRSYNRAMPEEINRVVADHVSDILFCPTKIAIRNLEAEGVGPGLVNPADVVLSGDVMYDCAMYYASFAKEQAQAFAPGSDLARALQGPGGKPRDFVLATVHRAENTDDPTRLAGIMEGLRRVCGTMPVVLPMHPRTRKLAEAAGLNLRGAIPGLHVVEPVSYFDMLLLTSRCRMVMTDSGGLQKEAFFFAKPCVTLRDETEWKELQELGANLVCGAGPDAIAESFGKMLEAKPDFAKKPYGNADASAKIVAYLAR